VWQKSEMWLSERNWSRTNLKMCVDTVVSFWVMCRVYYKQGGQSLIILLAGGDKHTQAKDIKTALRLARNL